MLVKDREGGFFEEAVRMEKLEGGMCVGTVLEI
jgi:hypothetical protein